MKCFLQLLVVGLLFVSIAATPFSRIRRQTSFQTGQYERRDPSLIRGGFTGFGKFQPEQEFRGTGKAGLTIPGNGGNQIFNPINRPPPIGAQPGNGLTSGSEGGLSGGSFNSGFQKQDRSLNDHFVRDKRQVVFPEQFPSPTTTAAPTAARTTPSPEYLRCMERCRTTNEYNPVCGSDGENYHNENRLECAKACGARIQLVRAGTCRPL